MTHNKKLDEIIDEALNGRKQYGGFTYDNIQWLCNSATKYFLSVESSLLELKTPICICGDLHGQFRDLAKALRTGGMPTTTKWLFLGDYVDRGKHGVEVVSLLLALKLRYPNNVYLIRGNHETEEISGSCGFLDECKSKFNKSVWTMFCNVFDALPIGATINGKIFCVHGGLSPHLKDLSQIALIERPVKIPKNGFLTDLLWSDPDTSVQRFGNSPRGNTSIWGQKAAAEFMTKNYLKLIIRGHQVAEAGYSYPFYPEKDVVTLFSASSYSGKTHIDSAFMKIQNDLSYTFTILQAQPKASRNRRCSLATIDQNIPVNHKSKSSSILTTNEKAKPHSANDLYRAKSACFQLKRLKRPATMLVDYS